MVSHLFTQIEVAEDEGDGYGRFGALDRDSEVIMTGVDEEVSIITSMIFLTNDTSFSASLTPKLFLMNHHPSQFQNQF